MKGERKCPVCDTPVPEEALECPSCGLPKELWPDQPVIETAPAPVAPPPVSTAPAVAEAPSSGPGPAAPSPAVEKATPETSLPKAVEPSIPSEAPPSETPPTPSPAESPETVPPPDTKKSPIPEPRDLEPEPEPAPSPASPEAPAPPVVIPPVSPVQSPSELPLSSEAAEPRNEVVSAPAEIEESDPDIIFAKLAQANKRLVELAVHHSVDVRTSAMMLKRAANFWKLSEKEEAIVEMRSAESELADSIQRKAVEVLAGAVRNVENMGPFASPQMREDLESMSRHLAHRDLESFFQSFTALERATAEQEKQLSSLGPMVNTLNLLETGIIALGNDSFHARPSIEKAFGYVEKGRRKEGEAVLAMAVTQAIEVLQPLIERRIVEISNRLKTAHARGMDVRAPAVLVKQITMALRARRFTQVLQLFERVDTIFPESLTNDPPTRNAPGTPQRSKGRAKSTISSSSSVDPAQPAPGPLPVDLRAGRSYLFLDARPSRAIEAFNKVKGDRLGLFLTSTFPVKLREDYRIPGGNVVWISESSGWKETLNPRLLDHEITARVLHFMEDQDAAVVLIDGLGDLVTSNGLDRTIKFLKKIMDAASSHRIVLISTLSPGSVEDSSTARLKGLFDQVSG